MKNSLLPLLLILSLTTNAQIQQATIGSLGGEIASADSSISFTQSIGDVAGTYVQAAGSESVRFTQGFVQCFKCDACNFPTDVTELVPGLELKVFPNPTTGLLEVSGGNGRIHRYQLTDATGRQVAAGRFAATAIDLSPYPPGFYVLQLLDQSGGGLATVKIIRR